jgi:hypothetical protein
VVQPLTYVGRFVRKLRDRIWRSGSTCGSPVARYWDCRSVRSEQPAGPERSAAIILTAPLSVDRAKEQVEGMMKRHASFASVEDKIDAARLSQHHKAALWLLAWSLRDPALQLRDARLMVAALAADGH